MTKAVGKTIAEQCTKQTVDVIVPIAVSFLRQGGQAKQFREHLLAEEARFKESATARGNQPSWLTAWGINPATLNGEVEAAVHEATIFLMVEQWYNVVAWKKKVVLYDYVRARSGLSEEAVRLLKPAIDRALCRCACIQ